MKRGHFYFLIDDASLREEGGNYPVVDLLLTSDEVRLLAELPGMSRDALEVKVNSNYVKIRGCRREPEFFTRATHFYKLESFYGSFERQIDLPVEIEPGDAKVSFTDGVLEIVIPRRRKRIVEIPVE